MTGAANLIALGQFLVATIVGIATFLIHSHNKRKDKLDFFRSNWDKQQDLNLFCIGNAAAASTVERMVYGPDHEIDDQLIRDFNFVFIQLNKIQNNYQAYIFGVISYREFLEMSSPSLQLLARNKSFIKYVVTNRGYSQEFQIEIFKMISNLAEFDPPSIVDGEYQNDAIDQIDEMIKEQNFLEPIHRFLAKFNEILERYHLNYAFVLNPILLLHQCYSIISAGSASQLSYFLIIGFIIINLVTMIIASSIRNNIMFISFFISFLASLSLLIIKIIL